MSDWSRAQIAAAGVADSRPQQQQNPAQQHYHDLQQMLAARNLPSGGHFLGISRDPPAPMHPASALAQQQQQHFVRDHAQIYMLHANPPPEPPSFKHLLSSCSAAMARIPSDPHPSPQPQQQPDHRQRQESDRDRRGGDGDGDVLAYGEWHIEEARALIKIRGDMESSFRMSAATAHHLWEDVSRKLSSLGYSRGAECCREKFESMVSYFQRSCGVEERCYRRFFEDLEGFYRSGMELTMGGTGAEFHRNGNNHHDSGAGAQQNAIAAGATSNREQDADCTEQRDNHNVVIGTNANNTATNNSSFDGNSSSASSAEYDEPSGGTSEYGDDGKSVKKRKRKSLKARMASLENLMKKFIGKQEEMQRKFFELLEKREQERMKRDEAWRKQEVARLNREYELRVEEHARRVNYDTALASALQKATGHVLEVPQQGPVPSPYSNTLAESNEELAKEVCDSSNKRWPKAEVQALIQLRAAMETKFQEVGPKGPFWDEISSGLAAQGYLRNAKRCKEKWENINKYYRKTSSKRRPENTKTCPYFLELDALYQKGIIGTPGASAKQGHQNAISVGNNNISTGNTVNNNGRQLDETTDEIEESNRDDSSPGGVQGETEVLSIMPSSEATPSNAGTSAVTGLFASPENCAHNTESSRLQHSGRSQKRSWMDNGDRHNGSLGLTFDALQGAELLCGSSSKSIKFDGFPKNLMDQSQLQGQQRTRLHHQHQRLPPNPSPMMIQERQSQDFQEAESLPSRGLVEGFGLVDGPRR